MNSYIFYREWTKWLTHFCTTIIKYPKNGLYDNFIIQSKIAKDMKVWIHIFLILLFSCGLTNRYKKDFYDVFTLRCKLYHCIKMFQKREWEWMKFLLSSCAINYFTFVCIKICLILLRVLCKYYAHKLRIEIQIPFVFISIYATFLSD